MSSHHEWVDEVVAEHDLQEPFAPENGQPLRYAIGARVIYTNPAGIEFPFRVTGYYRPDSPTALYARGARYYVDSGSPWFPVAEAALRQDEDSALVTREG